MSEVRPMAEFDPSHPALIHDAMNDKWLQWVPAEYEAHFREQSIVEGDKVGWDGLVLDGWKGA